MRRRTASTDAVEKPVNLVAAASALAGVPIRDFDGLREFDVDCPCGATSVTGRLLPADVNGADNPKALAALLKDKASSLQMQAWNECPSCPGKPS